MTGKRYPVRMVLRVAGLSSSTFYGKKKKSKEDKRGPKSPISDEKLKEEIEATIEELPFYGVGYKKIHARLQRKLNTTGYSVSKNRVYTIMRKENLLQKAPGGSGSSRIHDSSIITEQPNMMWGTDGKKFFTRRNGWCWLFGVIDHFNSEIVGYTVVKYGDRFEAAKAVQQSIQHRYGRLETHCAWGLEIRCDLGSQYTSTYFKNTMEHYGIQISYSWARSPECNGIIERFFRTIEEQVFSINDFDTIEDAIEAIGKFIEQYNNEWMLERLGYKSPREAFIEYSNNCLKSAC